VLSAQPESTASGFDSGCLPMALALDPAGRLHARPEPGQGVVLGALTQVLISVWEGERAGKLDRLKLCAAPDCRWAYYDASRNRSANWCNMAICGSRARSKA
jgi:predicted RNA-binding Zn ribbon-like protein